MSDNNIGGDGNYQDFDRILKLLKEVSKRLPSGVRFKRDGKYLHFQITIGGNKRKTKPSGCDLTDVGIYQALNKAWKIKDAIARFESESELCSWYDQEILNLAKFKSETTYRQIFEKIEKRYWESRNRNTGRKRSREIPNDVVTFNNYYKIVFNKFPEWDKSPSLEDIKAVLYSWREGSKMFKDAYAVSPQKIGEKNHPGIHD